MPRTAITIFAISLLPLAVFGQFSFGGTAPEAYSGKVANLDVIDGYADFNLISTEQLLLETSVDSVGGFEFSGAGLPGGGRFYRIRFRDPANCPEVCMNFLERHYVTFFAGPDDTIRLDGLSLVRPQGPNATINELAFALDRLDVEEKQGETNRLQTFVDAKRRELLLGSHRTDAVTGIFAIGNLPESDRPLDAMLRLEDDLTKSDRLVGTYLRTLRSDIGALEVNAYRREIRWLRGSLVLVIALFLFFVVAWWRGRKRTRPGPADNQTVALSPKEEEVLAAIGTGMSNKDIAAAQFISEATVKSHINSIYKKAGIGSRREAVAFARKRHLSGGGSSISTGL